MRTSRCKAVKPAAKALHVMSSRSDDANSTNQPKHDALIECEAQPNADRALVQFASALFSLSDDVEILVAGFDYSRWGWLNHLALLHPVLSQLI